MPCATGMRSFGLMGKYSTPMTTWFGPGCQARNVDALKTVDRVPAVS